MPKFELFSKYCPSLSESNMNKKLANITTKPRIKVALLDELVDRLGNKELSINIKPSKALQETNTGLPPKPVAKPIKKLPTVSPLHPLQQLAQ